MRATPGQVQQGPQSTVPLRRLVVSLALVALSLAPLRAQGSQPDASRLVWSFLNAANPLAVRAAEKELRAAGDLTLEQTLAALDGPPPLDRKRDGRIRHVAWTIPGTRVATTYDLLVPRGYDPQVKYPLWIGIHGTGGNGDGVIRSLRALQQAGQPVIIAAPTEAADLHGKGWGSSQRERMLHVGLIDEVARSYPVDRDRVVIMGWSRGGHGSFDIALRFSDLLAGAGPVIGAVPYRDLSLLGNLAQMRLMIINGARDQPALVAAVKRATARLRSLGQEPRAILDPARGHEPFFDRMPELVQHLLPARRQLAPQKLQFSTWDKRYLRDRFVLIRKLSPKVYHPGRSIKAPGAARMTEQERREFVAHFVETHTARVQVQVVQNVFKIRTHLVKRLELFLPLALLDLKRPVQIYVNDKLRKKNLHVRPPDTLKLLRLMKQFGGRDPGFRFAGKVAFNIR